MTVLEMHTAVYLGLDKSASYQTAAFEPEDIDFWLNEAQLELVKRKAFGNNYRREDLDGSVKHMEDLSTLIKEYETTTSTHAFYPNVVSSTTLSNIGAPQADTYMFFVGATLQYATTNKLAEVTLIGKDQIKNLIQTEYNIPFLRVPYAYIADDKLNIIKDPYSNAVSSVLIRYIKRPNTMVRSGVGVGTVTTCVLPVQVHTEVVALAVSLMLENIESTRFQTNQIVLNNKE